MSSPGGGILCIENKRLTESLRGRLQLLSVLRQQFGVSGVSGWQSGHLGTALLGDFKADMDIDGETWREEQHYCASHISTNYVNPIICIKGNLHFFFCITSRGASGP